MKGNREEGFCKEAGGSKEAGRTYKDKNGGKQDGAG